MDDIKEQMEVADEVAQAISQPLTMGVDFDEVISICLLQ